MLSVILAASALVAEAANATPAPMAARRDNPLCKSTRKPATACSSTSAWTARRISTTSTIVATPCSNWQLRRGHADRTNAKSATGGAGLLLVRRSPQVLITALRAKDAAAALPSRASVGDAAPNKQVVAAARCRFYFHDQCAPHPRAPRRRQRTFRHDVGHFRPSRCARLGPHLFLCNRARSGRPMDPRPTGRQEPTDDRSELGAVFVYLPE